MVNAVMFHAEDQDISQGACEEARVPIATFFVRRMVRRPAQEQRDVADADMARQPPDQRRFQPVASPGKHGEDDPVRQVLQCAFQRGPIDKRIAAKSLDRDRVAVGLTRLPSLDAGQDRLPRRGRVGAVIGVQVGIVGMAVMLEVSEPCDLERQQRGMVETYPISSFSHHKQSPGLPKFECWASCEGK